MNVVTGVPSIESCTAAEVPVLVGPPRKQRSVPAGNVAVTTVPCANVDVVPRKAPLTAFASVAGAE